MNDKNRTLLKAVVLASPCKVRFDCVKIKRHVLDVGKNDSDSALDLLLLRLDTLFDTLLQHELLSRPPNSSERIGIEFMAFAMNLLESNRTLESLSLES